jgi:short-subunit dehydrogenase
MSAHSLQGKICTLATSILGAFTPFYATYAGAKATVEHFTWAEPKNLAVEASQ